MAVVEHGSVDHAFCLLGKMLEVLVVRRDDAESTFLHETPQYGLCDGTTNLGLRATTELIDEQQRGGVGTAHHLLHIQEVRTIGRELVFNALLVANINHDVLKDA